MFITISNVSDIGYKSRVYVLYTPCRGGRALSAAGRLLFRLAVTLYTRYDYIIVRDKNENK